jgi:hypothetical protein
MRFVGIVVALGLVLAGGAFLSPLPAIAAAAAAIVACVLASALVAARASSLAIACGALAAVVLHAVMPYSAGVSGSIVIALLFAARTVRGRSDTIRGVGLLTSLVSGAVAAAVVSHYAAAAIGIRAASVLVGGVLAALPLMVPTDDAVAWSLVSYAREVGETSKATLLRAAALRRRIDGEIEGLSGLAQRRLEKAWSALESTACARVLSRGASADVLDQRIASHVDALERAYAAADERLARSAGLDDKALHNVRLEADAFAAEAAALAEVVVDAPATEAGPAAPNDVTTAST